MRFARPLVVSFAISLFACDDGQASIRARFDASSDGRAQATEPGTNDGGSTIDDGSTARQDAAVDASILVETGSGALCGVNGRNDCGPFRACSTTLGCVDCAVDG